MTLQNKAEIKLGNVKEEGESYHCVLIYAILG